MNQVVVKEKKIFSEFKKHTDEKLFLQNVEKFFTDEIIMQSPFDWKSWMPAGRPQKYYHDLLLRRPEYFVRAYAKRIEENIKVFLIFGAGFNFDLVNYEILKFKKKQLFNETFFLIKAYDHVFAVPTWDYVKNDWRQNLCPKGFDFRKRILNPNDFRNSDLYVYVE